MACGVHIAGYIPCLNPKKKLAQSKSNRPPLFWVCAVSSSLIMLLIPALICGLYFGLVHSHPHGQNSTVPLIVDLGYSKYKGSRAEKGVTQWFGIRYAAAPVGDLRFRAPRDPPGNATLQMANEVHFSLDFYHVADLNSMDLCAMAHHHQVLIPQNQKTVYSLMCMHQPTTPNHIQSMFTFKEAASTPTPHQTWTPTN